MLISRLYDRFQYLDHGSLLLLPLQSFLNLELHRCHQLCHCRCLRQTGHQAALLVLPRFLRPHRFDQSFLVRHVVVIVHTGIDVTADRHARATRLDSIPARLQGLQWLLDCAGKESNWLWKWKFRTADRHVRFDPDKYGWPWFPDTVSWVVPTAFAVLALNQIPCSCGGLEQVTYRVNRGIEMLLDRACPGGGWNAGNGVVYGSALAPHADDTAIALLALRDRAKEPVVQGSVDYLERVAATLTAPSSLACAILALAAHRRPTTSLSSSLVALPDLSSIEDTCTLAVVCLALEQPRALEAFGVAL